MLYCNWTFFSFSPRTGVFRAAAAGLAAVRGVRHVHDMVRGHHHQPGPNVHERRASRRS